MTFILVTGNDGKMNDNTNNKTVMKNREHERNYPFMTQHIIHIGWW
jgi:hypothetical protein